MISITRYENLHREQWNAFVTSSRNGTFLFVREYMDYHSDRFTYHSLLFFQGTELVAVMPANVQDSTLITHGGLTYGGIITNERMKAASMLEVLNRLVDYLKALNMTKVRYKAIPHIYHSIPSEEDLYGLFRVGASIVRRDISACIPAQGRIASDKGRVRRIDSGSKGDLEIGPSGEFEAFMKVVEKVVGERHGTKPVHSSAEMRLLASRFPNNIKLFTVRRSGEMQAGMIVYESSRVAHAQYIASTDEGRKSRASDILAEHLITSVYGLKPWFDFGISTEDNGRVLNEGLASFKEKFGARSVVYDTYELALDR